MIRWDPTMETGETLARLRKLYPPMNLTSATTYIFPDLLTLRDIGAANNLRGRVVRWFFRLMLVWRA